MTLGQQVGRNIAKARRSKGISQTQLALTLGTASQEISRLESGRTCPRLSTLLRLARTLEVPLTEFVQGIE